MSNPTLSDVGAANAAPTQPTRQNFKRRSKRMKNLLPYLLVAPAVIYLLLITLYPGNICNHAEFLQREIWPLAMGRAGQLRQTCR